MKKRTVTNGFTNINNHVNSINSGASSDYTAIITAWDEGDLVTSFPHGTANHVINWIKTTFTVTATGTFDCCFNCRMTDVKGGKSIVSGGSSKI